jgi:rhodanese-related sulfurtransferase
LLLCANGAFADDKPTAPPSIPGAVTVTAEEVIKLILSNPEIVLIDSRKKTEYLKGHIEGSINLLNTGLTIDDLELITSDKSSAIVFYCNGPRCLRSSDSVKKALSWGYSNIFWFRGGWKEWVDKKFPIIMGEYLYPSK